MKCLVTKVVVKKKKKSLKERSYFCVQPRMADAYLSWHDGPESCIYTQYSFKYLNGTNCPYLLRHAVHISAVSTKDVTNFVNIRLVVCSIIYI